MAELIKVNAPVRKPLFEGVQGENEARSIQFDITPWVEELGDGAVTATAKRSQDSQPYPVTVTKDGTTVTWKPTSTDTAFAGVGSFQLEYTVDDVLAKTCIWSTMVAPSLDPAGDPPDPYDNWLAEMRQIAADAMQSADDAEDSAEDAEAWAVGQRGGVDVPSTDPTYHNNSKYWAEQSLANQYGAFIVKSASGSVASFNDGADNIPMKSLNVAIVPKQAGSGDPSPSNVRPITGWSDIELIVAGINQFDKSEAVDGKYILYNGTEIDNAGMFCTGYIPCTPNTEYFTNTTTNGQAYTVFFFKKDKSNISHISAANTTFTTPDNAYFMRLNALKSAVGIDALVVNRPSTEIGYHDFNGIHTTPVPLGQTVYGGTVDVVSGVLTIDRAIVDLGTLNWDVTEGSYFYRSVTGMKANVNNEVCSEYATVGAYSDYNFADKSVSISQFVGRVAIHDSSYTDAAAFKTAVSGVQLCYQITNPTTVQLTPAQVATLLGTNNVWSDAGAVEVEYRADPTLAYNELANVIVSLGGNL